MQKQIKSKDWKKIAPDKWKNGVFRISIDTTSLNNFKYIVYVYHEYSNEEFYNKLFKTKQQALKFVKFVKAKFR